jgi:hypothetical protein
VQGKLAAAGGAALKGGDGSDASKLESVLAQMADMSRQLAASKCTLEDMHVQLAAKNELYERVRALRRAVSDSAMLHEGRRGTRAGGMGDGSGLAHMPCHLRCSGVCRVEYSDLTANRTNTGLRVGR